MQSQSSILSDQETIATNVRGDLTPAQRAALRSRLPGGIGEWFRLAFAAAVLSVVLYEWRFILLFFRAKDPLSSTEHLFGRTFTLSSLHLLAALIIGGWALVFVTRIALVIDRIRDSNELKPGHVTYADGTIVWDRHAYVALLPGRRNPLQPWDGNRIAGYLPGPYRLWYLRRGGWLLALQSLAIASAAGQADERVAIIAALANANGFLPDALDANRAGHLSERQVHGLARAEKSRALWQLVIGIGLIAATPAFWFYGYLYQSLLCGGAGLYVYVQSLLRPAHSALDADLAEGRVLAVDGSARKAHRRTFSLIARIAGGDGSADSYWYEIAGQRFPVSETAYHALIEGVPYRFYYLRRSKTLVNIEPLR